MQYDITERVVNALERHPQGVSISVLARDMSLDPVVIRAEMIDLEARGCVVRTGRTRGTRWHLA